MKNISTGLCTAALALSGCVPQQKDGSERPNIIFIMTDDHTTQAMSCYGSRLVRTPNLDRIAEEGIRFDNCYAANALSGPSRACILTGKFSHENGFTDNACTFDGSQQTFPKLLQKAGYGILSPSRRASTIGVSLQDRRNRVTIMTRSSTRMGNGLRRKAT